MSRADELHPVSQHAYAAKANVSDGLTTCSATDTDFENDDSVDNDTAVTLAAIKSLPNSNSSCTCSRH